MAQTLSEIKALLTAYGLRPKRRWGQNFLHDANLMRAVVQSAQITPGDRVLEVGAGTAALSEELLSAGAQLVTVEIDRDLEPILMQRLSPLGETVTVLFTDVLTSKHQINAQVLEALGSDQPFKLVANLPYQIASPLLINLMVHHPSMTLAVVMLQQEVCNRLTASPGTKDYGPMSIIAGAACTVECLHRLAPHCFWPPPKVDSAIVRLMRRCPPETDDLAALARTTQRLFATRRKQLGTILGRDHPLPREVDPRTRPEHLSIGQFIELTKQIG